MMPARSSRGHMQQTGARPDAVIGLVRIQLVEPHRLDGMTKPARGDLGHFGRAIGRTH